MPKSEKDFSNYFTSSGLHLCPYVGSSVRIVRCPSVCPYRTVLNKGNIQYDRTF